jgi:hypothetical protein
MSLGWSDKSNIYSNITGSVQLQFEARKNIVNNSTGRSDSQIQFLNSNTGWVKLSSGVKEKSEDSKLKGEENVLFGGVFDSNKGIKDGIFSGKNTSYTFSEQFGFRPMAGITNADIKTEGTFGAIKKATVEFQLNSVEELDKFEKLYMLPGYSVLLEWGHSMILDNKGKLNTLARSYQKWFIDTPEGNDEDGVHRTRLILDEIHRIREEQTFNYDALLGKISNYVWSFNPDGTYNCSVDITGYGELAESMSALFTPTPSEKQEKLRGEGSTNVFNIYLESILNLFPNTSDNKPVSDSFYEVPRNQGAVGRSEDIQTQRELIRNYVILNLDNAKTADGGSTSTTSKYITLGSLINLVNTCFCLRDEGKLLYRFYTGKHNPLDTKATDENVSPFITFDEHISSNLDVCFLPKTANKDRKFNIQFAQSQEVENTIQGETNDILNILVNVAFAKQVYGDLLENNKNEDINGYDYIKVILDNIAKSLGNINTFAIEARDEQYFISDRGAVPPRDKITYTLDLFGLKSLATNISIQSSIPSNLSTLISIGASAGGATLNENIFNFQSFYSNFIDRIVPQRELDPSVRSTGALVDNTKEDNEKLKKNVKVVGKFVRNMNAKRTLTDLSIEELIPAHQIVTNLLLKKALIDADTNAPGVIPLELSFEIMGISGLRITDVFNLGEGLLPERYKNNIAFTITAIDNSISNNRWSTSIRALMMVTTPLKEVLKSDIEIEDILDSVDDIFPEEILEEGFPNATHMRNFIPTTGTLFREKGVELTSAGMDITPQAAEFGRALMAKVFTKINGESQLGQIVREGNNQLYGDTLGRIESPRQLGPTVQSSLVFRWTAGNDSFHLYNPKNGNTLHRFGKALDLAIQQTHSPQQLKLATKIISEASAELMASYPHKYRDEYADKSAHATGGHFHFQFGGASIQDITTVNEDKVLDEKTIEFKSSSRRGRGRNSNLRNN